MPPYDANAACVAAFCLQCGSSLAGGAQFCSQCGARFGPVKPVQVFPKAERSNLRESDQRCTLRRRPNSRRQPRLSRGQVRCKSTVSSTREGGQDAREGGQDAGGPRGDQLSAEATPTQHIQQAVTEHWEQASQVAMHQVMVPVQQQVRRASCRHPRLSRLRWCGAMTRSRKIERNERSMKKSVSIKSFYAFSFD